MQFLLAQGERPFRISRSFHRALRGDRIDELNPELFSGTQESSVSVRDSNRGADCGTPRSGASGRFRNACQECPAGEIAAFSPCQLLTVAPRLRFRLASKAIMATTTPSTSRKPPLVLGEVLSFTYDTFCSNKVQFSLTAWRELGQKLRAPWRRHSLKGTLPLRTGAQGCN